MYVLVLRHYHSPQHCYQRCMLINLCKNVMHRGKAGRGSRTRRRRGWTMVRRGGTHMNNAQLKTENALNLI